MSASGRCDVVLSSSTNSLILHRCLVFKTESPVGRSEEGKGRAL